MTVVYAQIWNYKSVVPTLGEGAIISGTGTAAVVEFGTCEHFGRQGAPLVACQEVLYGV